MGVALTVVAAFAIVASVSSKEGGIHAAFSSVFSSRTVKVVISAHSTAPQVQAAVGRYSVALTVTSENGGEPLSGSDGRVDYEMSVLRGGVDLADMIVVDHTIYVRVDFQAIDPSVYRDEIRSLPTEVPPGATYELALAFLRDKWVGIDESTIESFVRSLGHGTAQRPSTVKLGNLRNVFTLSFAQSWDAWASIRQLSSNNGVTEYSVKLPVQHFVSTYLKDVKGTLLKDLPSADVAVVRLGLKTISSAIERVPTRLEIPITLWVTNGSLTRVDVTYKGDSVDLAISHPTVGVATPSGAAMVTTSMIRSVLGRLGIAGVSGISGASGISGISGISGATGISGISGSSSSSGMSGISGIQLG